ncbi:MAG: hypothetical protein ACI965_001401 [Paraglaciecola sp.]
MKQCQTNLCTRLLFGLLLSWSCFGHGAITEVTASVDKNPVMMDESFDLTVVANGDADRNAFDPSSLLGDFVVGRTSVSSQTQMLNFNTTRTTTWNTILIPRKQGQFTIPSFDVAGQKTQPISMMIIPVSASKATQGRDLFITTEIDSAEAYVQQQIHYTVKLHLGLDLQRGSLASPSLVNADIRQIGKDAEYNEIIEGRRFRIIERNFAVIPQQSGTFTIDGPLFEGEVVDNTRQSFGFFNRSKAINRIGPAQQITVLPVPTNYTEHWLPSDYVELQEEWQVTGDKFIAGEPLTRTITLTAVGMVEEQLPKIDSEYPDKLKIYPDQANTATVEKDQTLIAQRSQSIAIIPGQEGEYFIPPVSVAWFNIITKKTEYARLPGRTITVLPAASSPQGNRPRAPAPPLTPALSLTAPSGSSNITSIQKSSTLWSPSSWLLLALWLSTLGLWAWQLTRQKRVEKSKMPNPSEQQYWQVLQKSLSSNDPQQIYAPLSQWLGELCGNAQLALPISQRKLNDPALDAQLSLMLGMRYAKTSVQWTSEALVNILKELRKNHLDNKKSKPALKNMYPQFN